MRRLNAENNHKIYSMHTLPAPSALHGVVGCGLHAGATARKSIHAAGHINQRCAAHIITIA